ncbi:MAG: hypothetical protein FWD55_08920, partial [Propionibacteriaceae bacterium]|nr:hypothetical protein [Propionibacteriaceae bacterium]
MARPPCSQIMALRTGSVLSVAHINQVSNARLEGQSDMSDEMRDPWFRDNDRAGGNGYTDPEDMPGAW